MLSAHEVWEDGTSNQVSGYDTAYNQTRQLDYYANKGVTTTDNRSVAIKQYNGSNSTWWLRGAYFDDDGRFLVVSNYGDWGGNGPVYDANGFAPAFRIR